MPVGDAGILQEDQDQEDARPATEYRLTVDISGPDRGYALIRGLIEKASIDENFFQLKFVNKRSVDAIMGREDLNPQKVVLSDIESVSFQALLDILDMEMADARRIAFIAMKEAVLRQIEVGDFIRHPNVPMDPRPLEDTWLREHGMQRGRDVMFSYLPGADLTWNRIVVVPKSLYPAPFNAKEAEVELARMHRQRLKLFLASAYEARGLSYPSANAR